MYSYIKGQITDITPKTITLENNQIGYTVSVPNPLLYTLNDYVTIYTHMYIKDEQVELYGFNSQVEKELFLKLITCRGVGPKTALLVLSKGSIKELENALKTYNTSYFESFPGIGNKIAQVIVNTLSSSLFKDENKDKIHQINEALKNLGFKPHETKCLNNYIMENINLPLDVILKESLKKLTK